MRHTVTESLRAAALVCAAVAVALFLVHDRTDGARWDVLAAVLATTACTGAWALLTRREAPLGPPEQAPGPMTALPSVLPRNPVDWYLTAGATVYAFAPWAVFRYAAHGEVHIAYVVLGALPLFTWTAVVLFLTVKHLLVRRLPEAQRLLAADARAGRVIAVRFESAGGEWNRIVPEDCTKLIDPPVEHAQHLKLQDAKGKWYGTHGLLSTLMGPDHARNQLAFFGPRFKGRQVWVYWPERWQPVLAATRNSNRPAYPVAVIADTGDMVWGYAALDYTDRYLTDPTNLHATTPGLRARPVRPRPYFRPAVHGRMLLWLALALAALTPVLLGLVSDELSALLGIVAALAVMGALPAARRGNTLVPDPSRWTLPPVVDFRTQ
ncbi:hypothetical protein R6L23_18705 [Streptomyces sp. SR27]|uniref:hypothetical protein n=1 Tax=Streptomyces sp. SR27 TaxID=3076630 RepID=UPI00295BDD1A|nr:hypothetical protein [Streptomyces sp. SR27]MDV9190215.1 hypothetical protein [Streptomyces sp. SR27]